MLEGTANQWMSIVELCYACPMATSNVTHQGAENQAETSIKIDTPC